MYKPKEMSKKLGITVRTLQRWDMDGKLKAHRSPTGRRYYTEQQLEEYMRGIVPIEKKHIAYARVSSPSQKDDLQNQVKFLRDYANSKGIILNEVLTDIGSGLNYNRKRWNDLLDAVARGEVDTVYITSKDRFIRFGYEWFEKFCLRRQTNIVVLNNPDLSPDQELVPDLISIIHVFSCRIYGLRKYKTQIKGDKDVNRV